MGIVRGNHLVCNLERHECYECGKEFIIGTEMLDGESLSCPYCRSSLTDKMAWTEDENLEDYPFIDLGCLSISIDFYDLEDDQIENLKKTYKEIL